ncbi:class I SAM-dependent methyltransferase [Micromonospora purpureochromogenes]|uniref:class I SAM-dependent methyltransferase n=1 Tax=Micromonospora purpureochromogenes TaxID=47872 RepID=UPI00358DBF1A
MNGYYARPAILDLAGDAAGRRILDVGCGAGPLLAALRGRGAIVTGIEPSAKMLDLARQRLGDGTALHQGGLGGDPLPFPDAAFDDAIACLVPSLPRGLEGTARRVAARACTRRPTHRGRQPSLGLQAG